MTEETTTYTHRGVEYACRFRGNTLVDISPRVALPGYPTYLRDQCRQPQAAMKTKRRYVAAKTIHW